MVGDGGYGVVVAPRRPPGLAGLFRGQAKLMTERIAVFLDYQNVHLTAHGLFAAYGTPVEKMLVHPAKIAERIVQERRIPSELVSVAGLSRPS